MIKDLIDICSICLEPFPEKNDIYITLCNHYFHNSCIKELVKYQNKHKKESKCPMCNEILTINENKTKVMNLDEFIHFINNMINEYDSFELNINPEIILDNVLEFLNRIKNYNLPNEIFSKILIFDKVYKYSFFSYNYWFSKKYYKYELRQ